MSGRTPANQVLGQDILQCTSQSNAGTGLDWVGGLGWQPPRGLTRKQLENWVTGGKSNQQPATMEGPKIVLWH